MIHNFINDICEILNISVPVVSFDTSSFQSKTTMAQVNRSCDTIYIKNHDNHDPDLFFSIAHELRHVWQIRTNEELYLSEYKPVDSCGSIEEYNLQIAEIDANAFAAMVMIDFFRITPLFNGMPDSVKDMIHERMEFINDTEFSN